MNENRVKGQVESVGLVIIVIIMVLIGVFAVVVFRGGADNTEQEYLSLNANNLRESVLKTNIIGCSASVQDEIISCDNGFSLCWGSCEDGKVRAEIKKIIEASIAKNINYEFVLSSEDESNSFSLSRGTCSGDRIYSASQHLVSGTEIEVILCFF